MRFIFSFLFIYIGIQVSDVQAQQSRFLFLQTETRQPFNVTINKKVYSSTATGYLIVPKLAEGKYTITVGFGGNAFPDQVFNIEIGKKDVGYNVKNFADKGWGLFNLQSYEITMAGEPLKGNKESGEANAAVAETKPLEKRFEPDGIPVKPREESPEALLASKADRAVPSSPPETKKVEEKKDPAQVPANQAGNKSASLPVDNELPTKTKNTLPPASETGVLSAAPAQKTPDPIKTDIRQTGKSTIAKISQVQGAEAYYITYTDANSSGVDTIQVLVPNVQLTASTAPSGNQPKSDLRFLDIETRQQPVETVAKPGNVEPIQSAPTTVSVTPSHKCTAVATNQDFLGLRKAMAAGATDEDMMNEAGKVFKTMCFATTQVKNLSYLFLTDQGRYRFFDLAYPHVTDQKEFAALASEITDPYYLNRFKAMLVN